MIQCLVIILESREIIWDRTIRQRECEIRFPFSEGQDYLKARTFEKVMNA